jgi:hypothetical protein
MVVVLREGARASQGWVGDGDPGGGAGGRGGGRQRRRVRWLEVEGIVVGSNGSWTRGGLVVFPSLFFVSLFFVSAGG